ncbi:MAG TPA: histidine kinase [Mycobacteriales bacterium]|nr:histidine kinase [Mycobacteriales bacterium]
MPEWARTAAAIRRNGDYVAAAVLAVTSVVLCGVYGLFGSLVGVGDTICCVGLAGLVAVRRRWPMASAVAGAALMAVPNFTRFGDTVNNDVISLPGALAVFLLALALGSDCEWRRSIFGVLALAAGIATSTSITNPIIEIASFGPWLVGLVIASRRRVTDELALRSQELEAERSLFAEHAVRYERARIARELHDIVAHSVSLMVVQANAGSFLVHDDPDAAAEAFASIGQTASQASAEIARLVELLDGSGPPRPATGLAIVAELVRRAQTSGVQISCHIAGDSESMSSETSETAYRLVQEAVTNAMKHAPGAAIAIVVNGSDATIDLEISNATPAASRSGLERLGGGHGLAGMRERVARCGGRIEIGPAATGAWRVSAQMPRFPGRPTFSTTS